MEPSGNPRWLTYATVSGRLVAPCPIPILQTTSESSVSYFWGLAALVAHVASTHGATRHRLTLLVTGLIQVRSSPVRILARYLDRRVAIRRAPANLSTPSSGDRDGRGILIDIQTDEHGDTELHRLLTVTAEDYAARRCECGSAHYTCAVHVTTGDRPLLFRRLQRPRHQGRRHVV